MPTLSARLLPCLAVPLLLLLCSSPAAAQPALNLDPWKGLTFRLYRSGPWADADAKFSLPLENDGNAPVMSLSVNEQAVLLKTDANRKQVAPGKLSVQLLPAGTVNLDAGGRADLGLSFSGFSDAGTFETGLTLRAPGLQGVQHVPLMVEVTDRIFLPWLTIFFGVLAAFLVNYLSGKWRPREENRYRILSLRSEIEGWQQNVQAPGKLAALGQLSYQLSKAEERNQMDGSADVKAQLDQIQQALDAFRKAEDEQRTAAYAAYDALHAALSALEKRRNEMDSAQAATLDALLLGQQQAEALLQGQKLDAAEARIKDLTQQEKALEDALAASKSISRALTLGPETQEDEGAPLRIAVIDPQEAWVQKASLSFELRGQAEILGGPQGAQQFAWEFDDGQQQEQTDSRVRVYHRFEQAGTYLVRVSARRGNEELAKAWRRITIAPGRSERALAGVQQRLWLADLTLSLVALVIASLTGLWSLYFGKVFGSAEHYLSAFLWGFGIDSSVRGLTGVLGKLKGGSG